MNVYDLIPIVMVFILGLIVIVKGGTFQSKLFSFKVHTKAKKQIKPPVWDTHDFIALMYMVGRTHFNFTPIELEHWSKLVHFIVQNVGTVNSFTEFKQKVYQGLIEWNWTFPNHDITKAIEYIDFINKELKQ